MAGKKKAAAPARYAVHSEKKDTPGRKEKKKEQQNQREERAFVMSHQDFGQISFPPWSSRAEKGLGLFVFLEIIRSQQFIFVVHHMRIIAPARRKGAPGRVGSLVSPTPAGPEISRGTAPETRGQERQRLGHGHNAGNRGYGHGDQGRVPREPALRRTHVLPQADLPEFAIPSRVDKVPNPGRSHDRRHNGKEQAHATDTVLLLKLFFLVGTSVRSSLVVLLATFTGGLRDPAVTCGLVPLDLVRVFDALQTVVGLFNTRNKGAAPVTLQLVIVITRDCPWLATLSPLEANTRRVGLYSVGIPFIVGPGAAAIGPDLVN